MTTPSPSSNIGAEVVHRTEAAASVALHVLVLTGECDGCGTTDHTAPCCNDQHSYDWVIECAGVTDNCRTYWECRPCNKVLGEDTDAALTLSDALNEDEPVHGVVHRNVGSLGWATPSDECILQAIYTISDAVYDMNLPLGRHPVLIDDVDDDYVTLALAPPRATASYQQCENEQEPRS